VKLIGYVRVSTEEQASHGHSLGAQEAKLRAYCELYGHELTEVIVDGGQSAKSLARPGMSLALAALKTGTAEGLLVAKLDRLTRSVKDLTLLEGPFRKAALNSVAEQFDTTSAAGRLVLNLLMSVSQWEREAIGERTSAALRHLKSTGVKLGAPALADTATIGRAQVLRAQGLTFREVAEQLTAEGFATLKGGAWHPQTIKRLLDRVAQ